MRKLLFILAIIIMAYTTEAASRPKLVGETFRKDNVYLSFTSPNKATITFFDGEEEIIRECTWNASLVKKVSDSSKGSIYRWEISIKIYLSKKEEHIFKCYIVAYGNGIITGNLLDEVGKAWERI